MSELLLELFSEEIPAGMQQKAAAAYEKIFAEYFAEQKINFMQIKAYVGPRRLTVHATGLPTYIEADRIEIRGPKVDAPESAVLGFCRSNNITKDALSRCQIKDAEYFVYEQIKDKQQVRDILKDTLSVPIASYIWPKSMYWGNYRIKWVRPLRNILCILDEEIIDFTYGHLKANNKSFGHRFMANYEFIVNSFIDYLQKLLEHKIILDFSERKQIIKEAAEQLASEKGLAICDDEDLLNEVAGLVEYPRVMIGNIDKKFLRVPSQALISSMRTHQKYFSLFDREGNFAPYFLFVANKCDNSQVIIQGNEKVLAARLSDALYFYEQDLKTTLEKKNRKLDKIIFHDRIGTLSDKINAVLGIVEKLLPGNEDIKKAALYCKSDIVSEMVGEFPELQGIMGYHYAKSEDFSEEISLAIRDHYKPVGANDTCPTGIAAYLALADKLYNLYSMIIAGEKPTGSKDPFALRRQALGIVRIIIENKLQISLYDLTNRVLPFINSRENVKYDETNSAELIEFIGERARHFLKIHYPSQFVEAVLNLHDESDLFETKLKLDSLLEFSKDPIWHDLITVYKRTSNILRDRRIEGINEDLFENEHEKNLVYFLQENILKIQEGIKQKNYSSVFKILAQVSPFLSTFFDNVMVETKDQKVTNNRLAILYEIKSIFSRIANFDQL